MAFNMNICDAETRSDLGTKPDQSPDKPSIVLPQVLDLTQAHPLRASLVELACHAPQVIDASAVERLSTPCVQVLLAAGRGAEAAGNSLNIKNASAAFKTAIADLGLHADFSNWMD